MSKLFVIRFADKADRQTVRNLHLDAHLTWLEERKQSILVAGSLREQPGADPIGAWWVAAAPRPEKFLVYKTK